MRFKKELVIYSQELLFFGSRQRQIPLCFPSLPSSFLSTLRSICLSRPVLSI